uniref:SLED domain-containing protein n=1 Tax=Oryctolagus cuniculus TaxID=9986 RepID=A0A5F9DHD1_RABIT
MVADTQQRAAECVEYFSLIFIDQAGSLLQLKSQVLLTPLACHDTATIPNLAVPQVLTVCLYINKQTNAGPYLERRKVQQLSSHFGPEGCRPSCSRPSRRAHQQKFVFPPGQAGPYGVSACFDGKQHLRVLPVVNSVGYVLRFLAKFSQSLLCEDLFSHQSFPGGSSASGEAQEREDWPMGPGGLGPASPHLPGGRCSGCYCRGWEFPRGGLRAVCLGAWGGLGLRGAQTVPTGGCRGK